MKTANNKIPVSSVFNDSEGLYGTTVCRCLVRKPQSARLMLFGSRGPSEFATKCLDRDCVGRRRTGTKHGNVYHSVREKQGIVVYWLYFTHSDISACCFMVFRGYDLLKIANINPQQEATLSLWKKLVPRESGGNGA